MKEIDLIGNKLTELTEDDLISLCKLKGFEPEELTDLYLYSNKLTDINFIQKKTPFINLKILCIGYNYKITDISNIKYLTNLEFLAINELELKDEKETVKLLKTMKNLQELRCSDTFITYTYKQLKKELPYIIE